MADLTERQIVAHDCAVAAHRLMASLGRGDVSAWLDLDVTMAQFKALMTVAMRGPLSVGALARSLGIAEPSTSLLVDRLEDHGLARRGTDPDDRRRTLVTPTDEAMTLLDRLQQGRRERFVELIGALDDDDLSALTRGIGALSRLAESPSAVQTTTDTPEAG
jgi:DNA-binding MarR family transcriptional regulator